MEQYRLAKKRYPGMMLMFRIGDFYEMFNEDAQTASKLLGLTLTQRDKTPIAGLPYHQLESDLPKLLAEGKRVAVCEPDEKARIEEPESGHAARAKRSRKKDNDFPGGAPATKRSR